MLKFKSERSFAQMESSRRYILNISVSVDYGTASICCTLHHASRCYRTTYIIAPRFGTATKSLPAFSPFLSLHVLVSPLWVLPPSYPCKILALPFSYPSRGCRRLG